ncbi:LytR C-terminal domain-containing protein [Jatrophihabitans fulvus]
MANSAVRRPLPALIALLALLLLTGIVWWRVVSRDEGDAQASCPSTPAPTTTATLPAPSSVTLIVLNGTSRSGLAGTVRTELVQRGFLVPRVAGNDKKKVLGVADIRYGPKGTEAAKLLRYYFPGAKLSPNTFTSGTVVVSLGARFKALPDPERVSRELTSDKIGIAPASPSPTGSGSRSSATSSGSSAASPSPTC